MTHPASRALIFVLLIIIPLRLLAAGVVPIVGMPGHVHEAEQTDASAAAEHRATQAGAHDGCAAHAASLEAPADSLHEHGCPHLGMASMSAPSTPSGLEPQPPRLGTDIDAPFDSVVLEVPSPPPTTRA